MSTKRNAYTLIEVLVVIAILGTLISLILPAIHRVRDSGWRTTCANNLRQMGLALHNYHDIEGRFPPGVSYENGKSLQPHLSWMARLLPYLEQRTLWEETLRAFAQDPWFENNPPHIGFGTVLKVYGCPSDPRTLEPRAFGRTGKLAFTAYQGVQGTDQFKRGGVLFLDSRTCLADILDGSSHTLCVGERPPSANGRFGWWYGGWGINKTGTCDLVLGVRELNPGPETFDCPSGPYAYAAGRENNQCDMFHFWSLHTGAGANFLFADGAVRFLAYSADPIMPALATCRGGEAVTLPD